MSNPVEPRIVAQPATTCGSANEGLIKLAVQEELNKKTQKEKNLEIRQRNIIIYRTEFQRRRLIMLGNGESTMRPLSRIF